MLWRPTGKTEDAQLTIGGDDQLGTSQPGNHIRDPQLDTGSGLARIESLDLGQDLSSATVQHPYQPVLAGSIIAHHDLIAWIVGKEIANRKIASRRSRRVRERRVSSHERCAPGVDAKDVHAARRVTAHNRLAGMRGIGQHVAESQRQPLAQSSSGRHGAELEQQVCMTGCESAEHADAGGAVSTAVFTHDDLIAGYGWVHVTDDEVAAARYAGMVECRQPTQELRRTVRADVIHL